MRKILCFIYLFVLIVIFSNQVVITRDKTLVKSGPGNFYDNVAVLRINDEVTNLGVSEEDDGWVKIKKDNIVGFISNLAIKPKSASSKKDIFTTDVKNTQNTISPGAYTSAIKGFMQNYTVKKGYKINYDDVYAFTNFTKKDYKDVVNRINLSFFPKKGELIGNMNFYIDENLEKIAQILIVETLSKYTLKYNKKSSEYNALVNILNRQTIDYDKRYYLWIVSDSEPFAFSGPGGLIFISDGLLNIINDERELVAILAHEIGHIALRHGVRDLSFFNARESMDSAFGELDMAVGLDQDEVNNDLENDIKIALKAIALVRDDKQEFEADDVALEILRRYRIDKRFLYSALDRMSKTIKSDKYNEYKKQIEKRLSRIY